MHNPYQPQIDELTEKIEENKLLLEDPELAQLAQQEITTLELHKQQLVDAAQLMTESSTDDPATHVSKNCTLEIRPGAGGDEAKIWATDLLRMYTRFADTMGLKITYIDDTIIKLSGKPKKIIAAQPLESEDSESAPNTDSASDADETQETTLESLDLTTPYLLFRGESGVHRVQRVPATESQGRIHTSTASVAVLPEVHPRAIEIRDEDLEWQFMRASGAGGQSVNKTSSAVRLIHTPTGITVTCRQEKKQEQNRKIALELLRAQLWQIEEDKRQETIGEARSAIGRNMRAEKIRTYNYPQNRVTDHRINTSWYSLDTIIEGDLEKVFSETAGLYL